jgi:hypothetical protein
MTHKITGCPDCPLSSEGGSFEIVYCNHPSLEVPERLELNDTWKPDSIITPDWCPLKKESLTIEIEKP